MIDIKYILRILDKKCFEGLQRYILFIESYYKKYSKEDVTKYDILLKGFQNFTELYIFLTITIHS